MSSSSSSGLKSTPARGTNVYQGRITKAPEEDAPASETPQATEAKKKAKTGDDILREDFEYLETNLVGGKPLVEGQPWTLPDKQKGFAVDQISRDEVVKFNENKTWLSMAVEGRCFEAPWPGNASWFSGSTQKMNFEFVQPSSTMRVSDLVENTLRGENAMFIGLDKKDFGQYYGELPKERKDNHGIIQKISITGCNTKNLPHGCQLGFWTQAEDGEMRRWGNEDEQMTYSNWGPIRGLVLEPGTEFRQLADSVVFETDTAHICNPWISRFLQFDFTKFLNEVVRGFAHKTKNPNFIRIKAPDDVNSIRFTEIQWFLFTFYRYLNSYTEKVAMPEAKSIDEKAFISNVGESVIQGRYAPGAKPGDKPIGYEFVISIKAMETVVEECRKKVRAATLLANFERVGITLDFVGGAKAAQGITERMAVLQRGKRDELERNPLIWPFSAGFKVEYVSLPDSYPVLESQNRANLGKEATLTKIKTPEPKKAAEMPAVRPIGTSGRFYGTNSFRHSMNHHHHRRS